MYQAVRIIARYPAKVSLAKFPFVNIVAMCVQFSALHKWYFDVVGIILVLTVFELYFLVMIVRQVRKTWARLARLNYLKYRSKQVGFRFFVAHNLVYYCMIIIFEVLDPLIIPRYWQLSFWLSNANFHMFLNCYGRAAVDVMFTVNLAMTAYVNLPPDSTGFLGWFRGSKTDGAAHHTTGTEPLMVASYEPASHLIDERNQVHSKLLVLETHVSLFNFAWLVYEWNTKKHGRTKTNSSNIRFKIEHHIKDNRTDTNLIVVSADDRIILAFRGTTSAENLRTDMRLGTRAVSDRLPTPLSSSHNPGDWELARIHVGFFDAYMSEEEATDHAHWAQSGRSIGHSLQPRSMREFKSSTHRTDRVHIWVTPVWQCIVPHRVRRTHTESLAFRFEK
ncbi:Lipase domain protein [Gracilaria domingensis]|nr:Lipase domain protein [Gracilaria domingensis]